MRPLIKVVGLLLIALPVAKLPYAMSLVNALLSLLTRQKIIFWGFMSDQARVEPHLYACLLGCMSTFNRCFAGYVTDC
jgi:hypothetical protein